MSKTESPPQLWCYREIAELADLSPKTGYQLVSELAKAWRLRPVVNTWPRTKRLPRQDVAVILRALNRPVDRLDRRPA